MLALNATNFTYGDETQLSPNTTFDLLLSTTLSNFMQLGSNATELYQSWASEMQKVPGIECTMQGESPRRQGSCSLSLNATQSCEEIRAQMKNISIQIDDILYTVPPVSYTPVPAFDPGRCAPSIEF